MHVRETERTLARTTPQDVRHYHFNLQVRKRGGILSTILTNNKFL
jgi:hypothetical protein